MASCDVCGRPLCLSCAVPVRGRVLGTECLTEVLGPHALPEDAVRLRAPRDRLQLLGAVAFLVAFLATLLPWSRFGPGSGAFGAWGRSLRWSLLAASAATLGLALRLALRLAGARMRSGWDILFAFISASVVTGAVLAALRPSLGSRPWLGHWVAIGSGMVAFVVSIEAWRRLRRSTRERV